MNTDKLLYEKLTYKIRGAIFKVYNELGFGHKENVYQKALDVIYDGIRVGTYRPDFVIDGRILLELKAVPFLAKQAETQLIYYLKGTNFKLGLLANFGSKKLVIKRKNWTGYPRKSVINQW